MNGIQIAAGEAIKLISLGIVTIVPNRWFAPQGEDNAKSMRMIFKTRNVKETVYKSKITGNITGLLTIVTSFQSFKNFEHLNQGSYSFTSLCEQISTVFNTNMVNGISTDVKELIAVGSGEQLENCTISSLPYNEPYKLLLRTYKERFRVGGDYDHKSLVLDMLEDVYKNGRFKIL